MSNPISQIQILGYYSTSSPFYILNAKIEKFSDRVTACLKVIFCKEMKFVAYVKERFTWLINRPMMSLECLKNPFGFSPCGCCNCNLQALIFISKSSQKCTVTSYVEKIDIGSMAERGYPGNLFTEEFLGKISKTE